MIAALTTLALAQAAQPRLDPRQATYELRIYDAAPGKLDALSARFRGHTLKLFEKHGMTNVAYWVEQPSEKSPGGRVVYVLAYPDRAAREKSWAAFVADPEWKQVAAASEANGKLVAHVESIFMTQADYSPPIRLGR